MAISGTELLEVPIPDMFGLFFRPFHFRGYTLNSYGRLHMVRKHSTSNLLDPGDLPLVQDFEPSTAIKSGVLWVAGSVESWQGEAPNQVIYIYIWI